MKRFIVVAVLALALTGCAGTKPAPSPISSTQVATVIAQVQSGTRQVCSFIPTAQTVARILEALGVPYVGMVADISGQICDAVTTRPLADGPGDRKPRVGNVIVRGQFVR